MPYIGTQPKDVRSFGKVQFDFTATQGQTAFTGADDDGKTLGFTEGQIQVYVNGILMDASDYTTSNTNTVTLVSAANLNDIITVVALQTDIPNSDYVPISGGTFTGNVTFNINTSDGDIAVFQKDETAVGSIGTKSNSIYIDGGSSNYSLMLASDFRPRTSNGAANLTDTVDLGDSFARFRNLYLSGGVYLGGTGSSNKLDDYEEGTFNPFQGIGSAFTGESYGAKYTKIGRLVHIDLRVLWTSTDNSGNPLSLQLPFSSENISNQANTGAIFYQGTAVWSGDTLVSHVGTNSSEVRIYRGAGGSFQVASRSLFNGSYNILLNFTYETTA